VWKGKRLTPVGGGVRRAAAGRAVTQPAQGRERCQQDARGGVKLDGLARDSGGGLVVGIQLSRQNQGLTSLGFSRAARMPTWNCRKFSSSCPSGSALDCAGWGWRRS
jgi:hypothetical protein